MRKLIIFMGLVVIIAAIGCSTDPVIQDLDVEGRVMGTIQGIVTDAENNTLLSGVKVTTTNTDQHLSAITDSTGHYSFDDLDSGTYMLTYVYPTGKGAADAYAVSINNAYIPLLEDIGIDDEPHNRDFYYEVYANTDLYPLTGAVTGRVYKEVADHEYITTSDADGNYSLTDLPAGINGYVRARCYSDDVNYYNPCQVLLTLSGGGTYHASNLVLDRATEPMIVSNNFANIGIDPTNTLDVAFNMPMNTDSFEFTLRDASYSEWPVTPTWTGTTAISLDPAGDLPQGATWTLVIEGEDFYENFSFWTTGGTSPIIIVDNFSDGVPFPTDGTFSATFSTPMDPETFVVQLTNGTLVDAVVMFEENTLTIDPVLELTDDTLYTLELDGRSLEGAVFSRIFYITTVNLPAPQMLATNFVDLPLGVDSNLVIDFNQPMDPDSFFITFFNTTTTLPIAYTSTWGDTKANTQLVLNPVIDLEENTSYTLTLQGYSASGLDFSSGSITVMTVDLESPIIESTNFLDLPVILDSDLEITFSQAMDPATFVITFTGGVFDVTWSDSDTKITLDPALDLAEATDYTLVITGRSEEGLDFSSTLEFTTVNYEEVVVVSHNLEDGFPVDNNLIITFSQPMDPTSFEPFGNINLTEGGARRVFNAIWNSTELTLRINPEEDFTQGSSIVLVLTGQSASGLDYTETFTAFTTFAANTAYVTSHNIETGEFPVDCNLVFEFSDPMDPTTLDVELKRAAGSNVYGVSNWNADNDRLTFNPDLDLAEATAYTVTIECETALGGLLDGGVDDTGPSDNNYDYTFNTEGGITMLYTNLFQIDGDAVGFPADDVIEVTFSTDIDLSVDDNTVTLTNNAWAVPVLITYTGDANVLSITPDQDLAPGVEYALGFDIYSTLPGDHVVQAAITFTVFEASPDAPVAVTGFAHDDDTDNWATNGDFDRKTVNLEWEYQDGITEYRIYSRMENSSKMDFVKVATVTQPTTEPDDGMLSSTINFAAVGPPNLSAIFDSRSTDTPQTPFENSEVEFKITAVNSRGEGPTDTVVTLDDVVTPTGAFTAQDGSADDTDQADDGDDLTVELTYKADEYLDHSVVPTITITEGGVGEPGDPNYIVADEDISYRYETADGFTNIIVILTVEDGKNAAGDVVSLDGFTDSSGNEVATDDNGAGWTITDSTLPSCEAANQDPDSADNTADAVNPLAVVVYYTATELLNHTVEPTVTFTDGGAAGQVTTYTVASGNFAYSDNSGITTVQITVHVPASADGVGEIVHINGLTDMSANVQTVAVDATLE